MVSPRADRVGNLIVREIGTPRELLDDDPRSEAALARAGRISRASAGAPARLQQRHLRPRPDRRGLAGQIRRGRAGAGARRCAWARAWSPWRRRRTCLPIVAAGMPELMTAPLLATEAGTRQHARISTTDASRRSPTANRCWRLARAFRPTTETQQFIRRGAGDDSLPVILDADGLNAFAGRRPN